MTTWNDLCRTCMHGIREGVDSHDCSKCQEIAKSIGLPKNPSGYIFFKKPTAKDIKRLKKEYGVLKPAKEKSMFKPKKK